MSPAVTTLLAVLRNAFAPIWTGFRPFGVQVESTTRFRFKLHRSAYASHVISKYIVITQFYCFLSG